MLFRSELTKHPDRNVTFAEYSKGFFHWDGEWATDKKVSGRRIGRGYCLDQTKSLELHLNPVFGKLKLTDIDRPRIKAFKNEMFRAGYSGSLINKTLYALKAVLELAEERGIIQAVPRIDRAAERPRKKGILSLDEVEELFNVPWEDFRGYVGNLLAASSGIRIGELQALTFDDVHIREGYITVRRSWDKRTHSLTETTKNGHARTILIPGKVAYEMGRLITLHPCPTPDSFFFWGEKKPTEKPAEPIYFSRTLYRALELIGIDDAKRRERNITFHSWRHWLNSLMINAKIPLQKIQSITGHRTERMTSHYYHLDDMADVRALQESIFGGERNEGIN